MTRGVNNHRGSTLQSTDYFLANYLFLLKLLYRLTDMIVKATNPVKEPVYSQGHLGRDMLMEIVRIDKLQTGMILAADVLDMNGRLLLAEGEKIKPDHIRILKIWGISEVSIFKDGEEIEKTEPDIDPKLLEKTKEYTHYIFKHVDLNHPAINELFELSVLFRSRYDGFRPERKLSLAKVETLGDQIQKDVREKIETNQIKLPEIPSIVTELNEVIANPFASAQNIADVVNKSPSLTALLLKIINSPFYGFPSNIDSVSRAVILIGTREISSLAVGIMVISVFKHVPRDIVDMHSFFKHSLACGLISRILAAQKNLLESEQMFVSGLLHDIGRLIIYAYYPKQARNLLSRTMTSDQILFVEENSYLGCQHTDVAKYLLQKWKIPNNIVNNVCHHHNPSKALDSIQAAIIHLADIMVNGLGIGSSGERFVPPLDDNMWNSLELNPSCFERVIQQATHQLFALENLLQNLETK
jgi:HD-like signal output (HDOD) protein